MSDTLSNIEDLPEGTPAVRYWFITAQLMTARGPAVTNIVSDKHPVIVALGVQRQGATFTILFFSEIPEDAAQAWLAETKAVSERESRIVVPGQRRNGG